LSPMMTTGLRSCAWERSSLLRADFIAIWAV
jgi:hypothetical protein